MRSNDIIENSRTLCELPAAGYGIVLALHGGHEFRSRVANLGFTVGARLKVLQNYGHGPILVSLRGTTVALGRAEATGVLVRTPKSNEQLP